MPYKAYWATSLTGGTTGCLDKIDGADLADKDIALVILSTGDVYEYWLDDDSAAGESSPDIIAPDNNGGDKRWLLKSINNQDLTTDASPTFGGLTLTGGFKANLVTKTANYTATNADYTILCNASGGSFTVTLPTVASHTNRIYNIKKIDSSANTVTVDGNASETIDDSTTAVLTTQYESITIQSDGSEWWII